MTDYKDRIKEAMWDWLDRLADKIDRHYARLGIAKRRVRKSKKGQPRNETSPEQKPRHDA